MLKAGYAEFTVNPPLGIGIAGYYVPRFAKGFLDDITVSALVINHGAKTIALVSADNLYISRELVKKYCANIEKTTGIPKENIFISATHSHTAPLIAPTTFFEADPDPIAKYEVQFEQGIINAVTVALQDLKPAKMGYIVGYAPERVAYIRRYKMKDGSTMTCPPIDDPNIDHPIGTLDQRVNVVRFDRDDAPSIIVVNYGLHADTINGELLSADWPGVMKKTLDKALDGVKCMFFSGAEGDVGSTNVHPKDGDMNDTEISFDNEMKSPGMARFIGRALAGTVLQVYDKVKYVDVDGIDIVGRDIPVKANVPDPKDMPTAHKYKEYHEQGRDNLIPYEAMELTTVVAEALRMCNLEHGPETFDIYLSAVKIGPVCMLGIPGEPFTDIGVEIKKAKGFELIMPCSLTNGYEGYFPVQSAYDEGGYEARTSRFKAGVAETIIKGAVDLIESL